MSERYRPFSNGTQYLDWEDANCCQCAKYSDDASRCPLMQALSGACIGNGTVSREEAIGIGFLDPATGKQSRLFLWRCAEFKPLFVTGPDPNQPLLPFEYKEGT